MKEGRGGGKEQEAPTLKIHARLYVRDLNHTL